jgi:hypothetical protein
MKVRVFIFIIFFIQTSICFAKLPTNKIDTNKKIAISLDEQDRMILERLSPSTLKRIDELRPLSVYDVIQLSQSGVSDDIIIDYMIETKSKYTLNQEQIYRMQNSGVSQRVINYMIDSGFNIF